MSETAVCTRPCPRALARRRAEALAHAIDVIEAEIGDIGDLVMDEHVMPVEVPLRECNYGFHPDRLANDVALSGWEILMLLHRLHDRYLDEVLGPSEAA